MNLKELSPGIYKIRKKQYSPGKRSRANTSPVHLLRVEGYGETLKYYMDHDTMGDHPREMNILDDYEVVSRYDGIPQVNSARITISWVDGSGDRFEWQMTSAWVLRSVLDALPWLKKPFGYVARK